MIHLYAVITLVLSLVQALTAISCEERLENQKISKQFPMYVAHGSHSLTLNDIRTFFKPDADENNGISIVNFNLTDEVLLPNAPLIILDNQYVIFINRI
jgi:hypothetical protein